MMRKCILIVLAFLLFICNLCFAQYPFKPYNNHQFGFSIQIPSEFEYVLPTKPTTIMKAEDINNPIARASMNISVYSLDPQTYGSVSELEFLQSTDSSFRISYANNPDVQFIDSSIIDLPSNQKVLIQHYIVKFNKPSGRFSLENYTCFLKRGMNSYVLCYLAEPAYFNDYKDKYLGSVLSFRNNY